jgi:CHAT domain-containing protein/lipopolysaccharide biosynthesis regulator YciM
MHLEIRLLWLTIAILLMSLTGFPIGHLSPLDTSIALGQASDNSSRKAEADHLLQQGLQQFEKNQPQAALRSFQQALAMYQAIKDRNGEGKAIGVLGLLYKDMENYSKALEFLQQWLLIAQEFKNRLVERDASGYIGLTHHALGNYPKAIESYQQYLAISRELGDRKKEEDFLSHLGNAYFSIGNYSKAIEFHQRALVIYQTLKNKSEEGNTFNNLGDAYRAIGDYSKAIELYQNSLIITQGLKDKLGQANALGSLGNTHQSIGNYAKAIEFVLKSLAITREMKNRRGEGISLGSLGRIYYSLGNYSKAIELHQQYLAIAQELKDKLNEKNALGNLGTAYFSLGDYSKAIQFHQKALEIAREIGNKSSEGDTLGELGNIYKDLRDYPRAIKFYQQALTIARVVGDQVSEGLSLANLGNIHHELGNYPKAIDLYQQALIKMRKIGSRDSEALALNNLADSLKNSRKPALAIIFYKQAVNVSESIRKDLHSLPIEQQTIYTENVASSYRSLADLLFKENRIVEALQILDLLKVQELQDFLKDIKGNERAKKGIEMLPEEQQILARGPSNNTSLNAYLESSVVTQLIQQSQKTAALQNLKLSSYNDLKIRLQGISVRSALLYPLILPDRLELVLFTPNAPPTQYTVKVSEKELSQAILSFRQTLQRPTDPGILSSAQQLHTWLLKPLEADLKKANIQTIIYAPDGQLRYIPLAALHDGQKWAIENYQINYVTAFGLTSLKPQSAQAPRILAGAYNNAQVTSVTVNQKQFQFGPIPSAVPEIKSLAAKFPQTTLLLDKDFNRKAISPDRMNQYGIVHLATHGKLVDGSPEDSFVLLNNGEYVTLREIKDWKLPNVVLVVLSACQTALGEKLGSGIEIIGLGYQLQVAQARASIASLWEVSDDGTNSLMSLFYEQLQKGTRSSTQALAEAQRTMIQKAKIADGSDRRGSIKVVQSPDKRQPPFSHPYYWAPFILIGNGF